MNKKRQFLHVEGTARLFCKQVDLLEGVQSCEETKLQTMSMLTLTRV